jgi:nitrile hydratase
VNALVAGLERRGLTSETEIAATLERFLAGAGPNNGARLVARAWMDAGFKSLLLADANAAITQSGLDLSHWAPVKIRAVENTADVHNIVVCTLCSCYPIGLLGPSPGWYKSEAYRSRVVREPRAVLREFGCVFRPTSRSAFGIARRNCATLSSRADPPAAPAGPKHNLRNSSRATPSSAFPFYNDARGT